jgi:hypothetical protein
MFNRANTHYLFTVDKDVEKVRVGGAFRIAEPEVFLSALEQLGILAIREGSTSEGVVIRLASKRQTSTRPTLDTTAPQHSNSASREALDLTE